MSDGTCSARYGHLPRQKAVIPMCEGDLVLHVSHYANQRKEVAVLRFNLVRSPDLQLGSLPTADINSTNYGHCHHCV
jgi:hypothetical protein